MVQLQPLPEREWRAQLSLRLAERAGKTVLVHNSHQGPLRVFKPYYPERDGSCHIYLLHPPGGLVIGDELVVDIHACPQTASLLTTPSAGKVYGAYESGHKQTQRINIHVDANAYCEWLPQETIVFNGASGQLLTTVNLLDNANIFLWDIVCLGRPAGNQPFLSGECLQSLMITRNQVPIFIERNHFVGGEALLSSPAGLQGRNTTGTLLFTVSGNIGTKKIKSVLDNLVEQLADLEAEHHRWGLTQKGEVIILRYIGDSASLCRRGFELAWSLMRPFFNNKSAVAPRIWRT